MNKKQKKGEYDDCYSDLKEKLKLVKDLRDNKYPEVSLILELQFKIFGKNNDFYIFPKDIEELVEQFEEYLETEKKYLDLVSN